MEKKIEDYATIVNSKNYKYGGHYAPHDLSKKMLFGDLVTRAKEVGLDFRRVPKTNSVLQDIEICRRSIPSLYIHERCEDLLEHLDSYREGASGKPVHDKHSHAADAFRTMVMAKHLNLIEPYLTQSKKIKLPNFVGKAESYVDWDINVQDEVPLWKSFRNQT